MSQIAGWQRPSLVRRTVLWPVELLDRVEKAAANQRTTFTALLGKAVYDAEADLQCHGKLLGWDDALTWATEQSEASTELRKLYWEDRLEGSLAALSREAGVSPEVTLLGCAYREYPPGISDVSADDAGERRGRRDSRRAARIRAQDDLKIR
jgi:hypothetical protein